MKFTVLNRKVHSWGSIIIAIPLLLVIGSGILLVLKKDISWIQPPAEKGKGKTPMISFEQILKSANSAKEAGIVSWDDIHKLDIQPSKGIVKVIGENNYEVQIDLETAEVLSIAFRRSDIIEHLHDGTFFHDKVKYLVTLPTGVILFVLLVSGVVLFFQPYYVRYKRNKKKSLT